MAGLSNERVLFGGEFDPGSITKGVEVVIGSFTKLEAKTNELNANLAETTGQIEKVEAELKTASTALGGLDKSAKDYNATSTQMKAKIDDLSKSNQNLSVAYKNQVAEQEKVKAKNNEVRQSLESVAASNKKLQDGFSKPLNLTVNVADVAQAGNKLEALKTKFSQSFGNPGALLDLSSLDELDSKIAASKGEFDIIIASVDTLSKKLLTLEPGTSEFTELSDVIKAGNAVIKEYTTLYEQATQAVEESEPVYKSVRTRLQEMRNELDKLEAAGQEESQQYRETQLAAAALTDQYGDMQQQIRILASDTKNLDFGLDLVNAAASGFQAYSGAMELFGVSNKSAEESQKKLLAIMSLVQGAQQLQNLLLKEGVIRTVGADIATKTYAATQRLLATSFGVSAVAARTLSAALITTGVGALVVALGFLIAKIVEWTSETETAEAAQERLNKQISNQEKLLRQDVENIEFFGKIRNEKLKQQGLSESAIAASNQLTYNQKLIAYRKELDRLNQQADGASIAERGKFLEQIYKLEDERQKFILDNELETEQERTRLAEDGRKKAKETRDKQLQEEKAANDLLKQIRLELAQRGRGAEDLELFNLKTEYDKRRAILIEGGKSTVDLENLYQGQVSDVRNKYANMRVEAERNLYNELDRIKFEANERSINNLSNEFERDKRLILEETKRQRAELQANQTALLNAALNDRNAGLITPERYQSTVSEINGVFNRLFDEIDTTATNRLRDLGGRILQGAVSSLEREMNIDTNSSDVGQNEELKLQSEMFIQGKINYEDYQKSLNEIVFRRGQERLEIIKRAIEAELRLVTQRLQGKISDEERDALLSQQSDLNKKLSDIDLQLIQNRAENNKKLEDENQEHLDKNLQAWASFAGGVMGFLSDIERAEQQRLDRSIALQQKRVDNAREIANKGNAEYLELEQKRMDELLRKREESARKQMAIDNALRVSQTLVAAISAVANAASQGGILPAIAAGGAIIALIASMYAFVSQLQAPSADFWEGSEYVEGPAGKDKIKANVSRGEAIIPVQTNKEYREAVKAIYYKKVPAEALNYFVTNFSNQPTFPGIDYSRLANATDKHIILKESGNHEAVKKLDQLNNTMGEVVAKLSSLDNTSIVLDQYGFSLSIIKAVKFESLKWKT